MVLQSARAERAGEGLTHQFAFPYSHRPGAQTRRAAFSDRAGMNARRVPGCLAHRT